jgi:hypothetical protein
LTNPRQIFPEATISDRAALALFAWHSLIAEGARTPEAAASEAFAHADAMLREMAKQENWRVPAGWPN